jgi:hypothetical protein
MLLVNRSQFRGTRTNVDTARATVIANPSVVGVVVNHCVVVDVVHLVHIHTIDASVVIEMTLVPITSLVSKAHIAEAIIDAAVVADVRSPIAAIETVMTVGIAPIAGRP